MLFSLIKFFRKVLHPKFIWFVLRYLWCVFIVGHKLPDCTGEHHCRHDRICSKCHVTVAKRCKDHPVWPATPSSWGGY